MARLGVKDEVLEEEDAATADDLQEHAEDEAGSQADTTVEADGPARDDQDAAAADEDRVSEEPEEGEPRWKTEHRAKRRSQHHRRILQKQLEERDAALAALNSRLEQLERGQQSSRIESELRRLEGGLSAAERALKDAIESGESDRIIQAQDARDELKLTARQLRQLAQQHEQAPQRPSAQHAPTSQPRPPPPAAQEWARRNAWYGQDGNEAHSQVAFHLANALAEEGFDAEEQDFYAELDTRLAAATGRAARQQASADRPNGRTAAASPPPRTNAAAAAVLGGSRRSPGAESTGKGVKEPPKAEWQAMLANAQASGHIDTTDNAQREALKREYWAVQARIGR